jgi:hypothetical protein
MASGLVGQTIERAGSASTTMPAAAARYLPIRQVVDNSLLGQAGHGIGLCRPTSHRGRALLSSTILIGARLVVSSHRTAGEPVHQRTWPALRPVQRSSSNHDGPSWAALGRASFLSRSPAPSQPRRRLLAARTGGFERRLGAGAMSRKCRREGGLLRLLFASSTRSRFVPTPPNPSSPYPTGPSVGARPAGGQRRTTRASEARPFEVLDRSFGLLVCEAAPLALDGTAVGHGLPARPIPLDELRGLLLHPSVDFDARDSALSWLVGRAQADGEAWLVGLAGVLLPGVGRRVYPLCRAFPRLASDLEAEALAGLVQAIRAWPCGRDQLASRLVWAAARSAHRLLRRELKVAEREAGVGLELEAPARPAVHGELVLYQAVAGGVVSRTDAELIAATRIQEVRLRELAGRWGVGYEALRKRRQRAEAALAGWLADEGDVPAGPAGGGLVG